MPTIRPSPVAVLVLILGLLLPVEAPAQTSLHRVGGGVGGLGNRIQSGFGGMGGRSSNRGSTGGKARSRSSGGASVSASARAALGFGAGSALWQTSEERVFREYGALYRAIARDPRALPGHRVPREISEALDPFLPPFRLGVDFKEQVRAIRDGIASARVGRATREFMACRGDDTAAFAAMLDASKQGIRLRVYALGAALAKAESARTARSAAWMLSKSDDPDALDMLADHVLDEGLVANQARKYMGRRADNVIQVRRAKRRERIMEKALRARPDRPDTLHAIEALAGLPGGDVGQILKELSQDRSPEIQKVARRTISLREKLAVR